MLFLPLVAIVASAGIVGHQTARRDRLQQEVTASEKEYAALEKRHKELQRAAGITPAPEEAHEHTHHDDYGRITAGRGIRLPGE